MESKCMVTLKTSVKTAPLNVKTKVFPLKLDKIIFYLRKFLWNLKPKTLIVKSTDIKFISWLILVFSIT